VATVGRGGLLKQYREVVEDLDAVRGRIAIGRQVTALGNRPDRIACVYDDLTADNTWNRILKCGIRATRPWIRTIDLGRRWVELMALFEDVGDVAPDKALRDHLRFDRHALRYRIAIDWARWILDLISPTIRAGKNEAPALLFDMNRLFEAALSTMIRRRAAAAPQVEVRTQDRRHHLADTGTGATPERRTYQLRPDIVVSQGHKASAIGDTKWKLLETDAHGRMVPDRSDMYQMHAYAAAYRCTDLALLYPWHAGLKDSVETRFDLPAIGEVRPRVHVLCVDVGQDGFPLIRGRSGGRIGELMAASE
jgi:5-methylcytosine-specific restriction enzyme subunit McrC